MAVTIDAYDQLIELMSNGTMDMDGDVFQAMLAVDAVAFDATHTLKTQVTEIATGFGYNANGDTFVVGAPWAIVVRQQINDGRSGSSIAAWIAAASAS